MVQVRALAGGLPPEVWQVVTWREGTAEPLASRFAALRVRPARGDSRRSLPRPEEWLFVEWPEDAGLQVTYLPVVLPQRVGPPL